MSAVPGSSNGSSIEGNRNWSAVQLILGQSVIFASILYAYGSFGRIAYWATVPIGDDLRPPSNVLEDIRTGVFSFWVFLIAIGVAAVLGSIAYAVSKMANLGWTAISLGLVALIAMLAPVGVNQRTISWIAGSALSGFFAGALHGFLRSAKATLGHSSLLLQIVTFSAVTFAFFSSFYAGAVHATTSGWENGLEAANNASQWPNVTIYSEHDLHIAYPNISITRVEGDGLYKWRYENLRLLTRNAENTVVVGPTWKRGERMSIIKNDLTVRFDIQPAITVIR